MSRPMGGLVILVDDDQGTCETIGDVLRLRGYDVETMTRGRAALDRLGAGPADVAVFDVRLPDIAGLELLEAAKVLHPTLEVIVITGFASVTTAVQAINGAAFAYLVKPFEMEQLLAIIAKAVEKQHLVRAVRESEERYRLLVEHMGDAVLAFDLEGRVQFVNRRATELTGHAEAELLGQPVSMLLAPERRHESEERLARVRAGEEVPPVREAEIVRKDGRSIRVQVTVTNVLKEGRVVGRLALMHDLSERLLLENQLRQSQKMEAVGRLAGGVAHDFNNLLTVIGGRAVMALDRVRGDPVLQPALEIIARTADRAAALTSQLLAFSRRQILQPRVLEINAVVKGIEPILRRVIGEDVDLVLEVDPAAGTVRADPGQLEQVILNLAVNARDAMPQGGRLVLETANVELDETYARQHADARPGAHVLLAVSDTGTGMDAATQARLFEPFFTTKPLGKGTGLGLSTVYGIVRQSEGHVAVYSELGHGTSFKVYLPRVDAAPDPTPVAGPAAPTGGTETVLLVEDEEGLRELAREILEMQHYTVIEAATPGEALARLERHPDPIHLLVTDVIMPQMSGRQLAAQVTRRRPEVRVLYMSGYTDDAIVHHGVLDPGTPFLQKPFTPASLARKVREILDAPLPQVPDPPDV